MITDAEKPALITAICARVDDRSGFHGYPANQSWLWGVVEKAVEMTLMAERDDRSVADVVEAQDILDVFAQEPKPLWTPALGGGSSTYIMAAGMGGAGGGPATCGPFAPTYALPPIPMPNMLVPKFPKREPDRPDDKWRNRVDNYKHHSPNWLNGPNHQHGITFLEAAKPKRRHKCWAQTWGTNTHVIHMEFCPCGAWRMDGYGDWSDKNTRPEGQ